MKRFLGMMAALAATSALVPVAAMAQAQSTLAPGELSNVGTVKPVAVDYYFPGANYDPAIPSPLGVLGYNVGEAISPHAKIMAYFDALAAAQPNRVKLFEYGRSWQGKRLIYAAIGTPDKIANLDAIQADAQRLADPRRLSAGEAEAIIARHPAVVWLAYSVHGDEISPADSAIQLAYHLLAARGDPRIASIAANTLVIMVPIQNPDGRDRFISGNTNAMGLLPDTDQMAAERDQQWPGGRINHANFDLNRDWFAMTQPETRAHTAAMLKYYPAVVVDAHEMGTEQTFFFPPEANPINPTMPAEQRALRAVIGQNTGRLFDQAGINYFTRENYDAFYPGYGDGWPSTQGAVAMTFEQGSTRGLAVRRNNGSTLTYADAIKAHFTATLSTVEVAARDRARFVRAFYDFRRTAIAEGRSEAVKAYVIPAQPDQATADKLAAMLVRNGIEVGRARAGFSACGKTYGVGSYVVSAAQPTKRLIRNLLEREIALEPTFIAEQERRRRAGLEDEIYDVTAWSLPLLYNVSIDSCATDPVVASDAVGPALIRPVGVTKPEATVAFVVPSGSVATSRFMATALRAGINVRAMEDAFTLDGRNFPAGSLVVLRGENGPGLDTVLADAARTTGASIIGFDTSWVTQGPSLGSERAVRLRNPRIAIAWDSPVDRYSAGATRYVLERKFGVPITPIRTRRMASAALGGFDVIIIPDAEGDYGSTLGEAGARNLKTFARNGGVVIGLGGGTAWMAAPDVDLTSLRRENATVSEAEAKARLPAAKPKEGESTVDGVNLPDAEGFANAINERARDPIALDGAIVRAQTTGSHWLTAGVAPNLHLMLIGSDIYRPLTRDQGDNVVTFAGPRDVAASGIVWQQNREQLAFKPVTAVERVGRGYVVAFTIDPTYRGQADGLDALLMNAIYQTTARARPNR
jgi:putative intracellular protease/amidase